MFELLESERSKHGELSESKLSELMDQLWRHEEEKTRQLDKCNSDHRKVEAHVFFDGRRPSVYRKLSGELFEAYPVYSAVLGADSSSDFTGVFRAAATKSDPSLEVIVTKTGSAVGGKYFYDYFLADVPFEWGHFNPHRRGLFLTSGEFNGSRKWAHLRGQLSADGRLLKATYILSGRGIQREFTLDRIER